MYDAEKFLFQELNPSLKLSSLSPKSSVIVTVKCPHCSYIWLTCKKSLVIGGCPSCRKSGKSFWATEHGKAFKETYSIEVSGKQEWDTIFSAALYDLKCPTCHLWFRIPLKSALNKAKKYGDICGNCNPQWRVKSGVLFKRNYPNLVKNMITDIPDDFYVSSVVPVLFNFSCGHIESAKAGNLIAQSEKCSVCLQTETEEQNQAFNKRFLFTSNSNKKNTHCATCEKEINISFRKARDHFLKNKKVICLQCQYPNPLIDPSKWQTIRWSASNTQSAETLTTGSGYRAKLECIAKGHLWENFVYAIQDKCPHCYSKSNAELEIASFLDDLGVTFKQNDRSKIAPQELDFVIEDAKMAIEYNGLYWHREAHLQDKNYHKKKFEECQEQGLTLFTIWESDWLSKKDLVKGMLAYKLQKSNKKKIAARKTLVKEIEGNIARSFLNENHLQGASRSTIFYGAFYQDSLIAVIGFTLRKTGVFCLDRYATAFTYQGGFSKMLKHFINSNEVREIVTFSDNAYSDGNLYSQNGFISDEILPVDYKYIVGNDLKHKFNFRRKRFQSDPALFWDETMSESELAKHNGLDRVWDCGKIRWRLTV